MTIKTLAVLSAAALSLTACGKSANENAAADNAAAAMLPADANSADANIASNGASSSAASNGEDFTKTAAASDAFEIASSKLASSNNASAKIKTFATQMIAAHSESTAKLQGLASSLKPAVTPDPTLAPDQDKMLEDLKGKKGTDFDAAYAADQVQAHQKTLEALKAYAATGEVPELKTFAAGMIPTVTAHLNMAKTLAR